MRRFLSNVVAAMVLGLALMATAEAGQRGGSSYHDSHRSYHEGSYRSYHEEHGTRFNGGYYYKGFDHHHWSYRYWYGQYGCYTYYCPSTSCWYYWYAKDNCYYPVSYIRTATPVFERAPANVETKVQQIVNVTNNSPGSVTVGKGGAGTGGPSLPAAPLPPGAPEQQAAPMPPAQK
jgi:hypothetical protein